MDGIIIKHKKPGKKKDGVKCKVFLQKAFDHYLIDFYKKLYFFGGKPCNVSFKSLPNVLLLRQRAHHRGFFRGEPTRCAILTQNHLL